MTRCLGCMAEYDEQYDVCPRCGYVEGTPAAEALHMEPGSILHDRYIVGKVLGFGGFGVTYIGWDALLEQAVAIKEYLPSEFSTRMPGQTQVTVFNGDKQEQFADGLKKFVDEAQRLAQFHNTDGIVRIFDSFEDNGTAYIIMEYLDGETLKTYLEENGTISPEDAVDMLMPVMESLRIANEAGIIHRDIAPDNIFLTRDGRVKLIDFGAARYATTSHSRSLTVIIKPGFSPEEQYRSRGDQGPWTDVYAIGATLYKIITGKTPPDALERRAMFEGKKKDILKPLSRYCEDVPDNTETAILNALNVRIEDRTQDMAELIGELTSEAPVKRRAGKIKKIDVLKWPLWMKISVPAAAALVITLSVLFVTGVIRFDSGLRTSINIPEGMSRVPSVISNTLETAEERLTDAALLYQITGKEYSSLISADLVLTQGILAGSVVESNSVVEITVSGGAEMKDVPSTVGLPLAEAKALLEDAGFVVETKEAYDAVVAKGAVIAQDQAADSEYGVGGTITITVSKGPDPDVKVEQRMAEVPDLVGLSYSAALQKAREAGYAISVKSKEYSSQYDKDIVMQQSLTAGSEVMTGTTIQLTVSLGIRSYSIPDVQYKTEAQARSLISDAGLTVQVSYAKSETVAEGVVISQSPAAKANVSEGAQVSIVVSSGGESFAMPNVVGQSENNAKSTLSDRGLSVSVSYERSTTSAEGTVLRQSISAGSDVKRGQNVTITVSSGQELISVANVVGRPESEARSTLQGQGLKVSVSETYSASVAKSNVISQSPNAGSSQTAGTTVYLTVSAGREPETTTKPPATTTAPISTTKPPTTTTTTTTTTATTTTTQQYKLEIRGGNTVKANNTLQLQTFYYDKGIDIGFADGTNSWSSSNANIATINANGLVTGKAAGTVTITVKRSGYRDGTHTITVTQETTTTTTSTTTTKPTTMATTTTKPTTTTTTTTAAPAIKITEFRVGKSWEGQSTSMSQFSVNFSTNVEYKKGTITVESSTRKATADVSSYGQYRAGNRAFDRTYFIEASNKVTIFVEDANGNTDTYTETINFGTPDIAFTNGNITMNANASQQVTANLLNGATSHNVVWESSNSSIVSVSADSELGKLSSNRTLTAHSAGTATITAKFGSSSYGYYTTKSFTVTVNP